MKHRWYTNKNNILLKNYFLVLVAYHGSSSNLILAFLPSPSETKVSKGGVRQEREFQPTHSDDTAVLLRYLRLVIQNAKYIMRSFAGSHRRIPIKMQSSVRLKLRNFNRVLTKAQYK